MPKLLFLFFTFLTEALIVYTYAKSLYNAKRSKLLSSATIIFAYMLLLLIYNFFSNEIFNTFIIIFSNILLIYFLFDSSIKSAVFHGFALGISQLISEFIALYLIAAILQTNSQEIVAEHFEIGTSLSRVIYFFLSRLLTLISFKEKKSKSWGKWFALSLLPLSSIFIIIVFRLITDNIVLTPAENTLLISSIFFLLLVNIVIYMIYEQAEINSQKLIELEIANQKNDIDLKYLSLLEKKNETMQIMAHDYKNHLQTVQLMTDSPEIKTYINGILGEIHQNSQIGKSKNKLLDVIISKYADICKDKRIKFEVDVMSENMSFMNGNDISALFNNLLDNAVEAAEKSEKKYIQLSIATSLNSYHIVTVVNSSDFEPNSKNERLITTKDNKSVHGFGTKSINKIVNKYHGEMQWEYSSELKEFKSVILIPIEQ